jgi:hypothetical protein
VQTLGEEHPQTKATASSLAQLEAAHKAPLRVRRPERVDFSQAVLELRQRVMWPDEPLSYSAVAGDETEARHFGVYAEMNMRGLLWGQWSDTSLASVVSVWLSADGSEAQFRKFCTATELQRKGIGTYSGCTRSLLDSLICILFNLIAACRTVLHAQGWSCSPSRLSRCGEVHHQCVECGAMPGWNR